MNILLNVAHWLCLFGIWFCASKTLDVLDGLLKRKASE